MSSATAGTLRAGTGRGGPGRLFDRELARYPNAGARAVYLGLTVLATVVLFYELYIGGAVATKIIREFHFTFAEYVFVGVIGNAVGAVASLLAGLADRWGRANLVVGGMLASALLIEFALPNASSKAEWAVFFSLLSLVEGMALVATPALIRDFSPQLDRGLAMAFWTMGPALGSLVVTQVSSHTLASHPDWQFQLQLCGVIGLVAWVPVLVGLRELSPQLRDQLMVSGRDRALIEARAAGIDPEKLLKGHWRQMLRLDIVGPAVGMSAALLMYYTIIGFLVVYFVTVFGYSEARTNHLGNWYWIANVVAILAAGFLSDRLRVRKPFILVGVIVSAVGLGLFAAAATAPGTGYHTFALYLVLMSVGGGLGYVAWMAAFTETVEKHNPAATATGLAVANGIIRIAMMVSFAILPLVVPATSTLANHGSRVQQIAGAYPAQVKVLQTVDPSTLATLSNNRADQVALARAVSELSGLSIAEVAKVSSLSSRYANELATAAAIDPATQVALATAPTNTTAINKAIGEIAQKFGIPPAQAGARLRALGKVPLAELLFMRANGPKVQQAASQLRSLSKIPPADLAYLQAHANKVAAASEKNPGQWQAWWWVCFIGRLLLIPLIFLLAGRWSPRKARQDERAHERMVERELARLQAARAGAGEATPSIG